MKKLIVGLVLVGLLIPSVVGAYPCGCEDFCQGTKWYEVEYFDESHEWVSEEVAAWSIREAAWKLGLDRNSCFISFVGSEDTPMLYSYKVSYFDSGHNWVTDIVEAESTNDAISQLGLTRNNCFASRVFAQ